MTVKENSARIDSVILEMNKRLGSCPTHEDLNQISKYVEESVEVLNKKLDKIIVKSKSDREDVVQFKRDCGQDILQGKRKIASLEREVFKDRSRY